MPVLVRPAAAGALVQPSHSSANPIKSTTYHEILPEDLEPCVTLQTMAS
jgi:hypothetical protein